MGQEKAALAAAGQVRVVVAAQPRAVTQLCLPRHGSVQAQTDCGTDAYRFVLQGLLSVYLTSAIVSPYSFLG